MLGQVLLIAEEVAKAPVSGLDVAGWTGTTLLGGVLWWLLYNHLPAKDKQISDLVAVQNKVVSDLVTTTNDRQDKKDESHAKSLTDTRTDFKQCLDKVVAHCSEEMEKLTSKLIK
jgi:hypothetical protein